MLDYQQVKLIQAKRKKVLMLTHIISIVFHMLLFFAFNLSFVPFREVKVSKIMRIKRVNIQRGKRPGPLSASSAKKKAKPKPIKKLSTKPRKKRPNKRKKIKSKLKIASKKKEEEMKQIEQEMALMQEESEYDVLSMIEGDQVIPGGGNLGDDEDVYGLVYDEFTEFAYGDEEDDDEEVASVQAEKYLGTTVTPEVNSIPYTSIGETFTDIPYPPAMKIKREKLTSGICRVWLRLDINSKGEIASIYIRSPKTKSEQRKYSLFVDAVVDTVRTWTYDSKPTTVFVDVRFTIE